MSEADEAFDQFAATHMLPSRMFATAVGLDDATAWEREHIRTCPRCQEWIKQWLLNCA